MSDTRRREATPVSRAGEVAFLALLAAPLLSVRTLGPDGLRLPVLSALAALLSLRVAYGAARKGDTGMRGDPARTAMIAWFVTSLLSIFGAVDGWASIQPLVVLGIGITTYLFVTSGAITRGFLLGQASTAIAVVGLALSACILGEWVLDRPAVATIGNTNTAGSMAGMLFPFVFARAFGTSRRILFAAAAAALFVAVLATHSRGGFVGMMVGALLVGGVLVRRWGMILGLVVVAAGITTPLLLGRHKTVQVRLELWRGSWKTFLGHPVVGCGVGNFAAQYPPHRTEAEYRISNSNPGATFTEAENAHSTWVQVLAETGVPGLLSLLLLTYVVARLWRYYAKTAEDADTRYAVAGAGGAAAVFLVSGLFNTLHIEVSHVLYFFVFLGLNETVGNPRVRMRRGGTQVRLAAYGALVIVGVFATLVSINRTTAQHRLITARDEASLKSAVDADFRNWRTHAVLGQLYAVQGRHMDSKTHFQQVLEHRPYHLPSLNGLAVARVALGSPAGESLRLLDEAIRIAPYYYKSYFNKGMLLADAEEWAAARAAFSESIRCHPGHANSYLYRGHVAARQGDPEAARADFRKALELDPKAEVPK